MSERTSISIKVRTHAALQHAAILEATQVMRRLSADEIVVVLLREKYPELADIYMLPVIDNNNNGDDDEPTNPT